MNDSVPLFSIVIPTYNRANFIARAINSVLEQTFKDWELIVVDDGSTDGTKEVVEKFRDKRIRYFWKENEERSVARNFGIIKAKGNYLCFLDSDDYFLPNHLEVLFTEIQYQNQAVGIFRCGMKEKRKRRFNNLPNYQSNSILSPVQFIWENPITLLSIAFHRDICEIFQFPPHYSQFEDLYFLINVAANFPFFQIEAYTTVYVNHDAMSCRNLRIKDFENQLHWLYHLYEESHPNLREHISPKMQHESIARLYLKGANDAFLKRQFGKGIRFYGQALSAQFSTNIFANYRYTFLLFWSKLVFNYPNR